MANFYTHADGWTQRYGPVQPEDTEVVRESREGLIHKMVFDFDYNMISTAVAWNGDTAPQLLSASIPDGAYIEKATLVVKTAFVGATATLNIGTYDSVGTAIDADGIDAVIAVGALTANAVIACNGAQVGAVLASGPAFLGIDWDTAAFTAGSARLTVEYVLERT